MSFHLSYSMNQKSLKNNENFIFDYYDQNCSKEPQLAQQNVNLSIESYFNDMEFILDTYFHFTRINH